MTLDEMVQAARESGAVPPPEEFSEELAAALVDAGMSVIRADLAEAARLAKAALAVSRRLSLKAQGQAERLMGHTALLSGDAKRAARHYRAAQKKFAELPGERAATAVAMLQALAYLGQYSQAFQIGEEAIEWFEGQGDRLRAARVQANLANACQRLDDLAGALERYEAAVGVLAEHEAVADLAVVARNYAVCLMSLQRFDEADRVYAFAREVFEAQGQTALVLEVDLNRAYLVGRTGRLPEALAAYRQLRGALPDAHGFEIGHCLLDQADFMLDAGLWSDARTAARQAAEEFARLGIRFELGKALLIEGMANARLRDFAAAQEALKASAARLRREPNPAWRARVLEAQAEMARSQARPRMAYRRLLQAEAAPASAERLPPIRAALFSLAIDLGQSDATSRLKSEAPAALRAKLHRSLGETEAAEEQARLGLAAYDAERLRRGPSRLRQAAAAAQEEELRECFRSLRRPEERMAAAARLKGQTLAELLRHPEAASRQPSGQMNDDELEQAWAASQISAAGWTVQPSQLPHLAPGERFAEIFSDQGRLMAFVIEGDSVEEIDLGSADEAQRLARLFRMQISRLSDPEGAGAWRLLGQLGELLRPLAQGRPSRLILGRDAPLMTIPFHALVDEDGMWMEGMQIRCAPSAWAWSALQARPKPAPGPALVIGAADSRAPLIFEEALMAARALGVEPQPPESLASQAESAEILHLAAHGINREDRPLLSSLLLGSQSLTVIDVLQMRLKARLACLSGCSTGASTPHEARDAQGLIEALLTAGSGAVVASLWRVSDEAALDWMKSFYEDIQDLDRAFARAAAETRRQRPHPAAWAPFMLFGAGA